MPHITGALSINDGLTTPVLRTFSPRKLGMESSLFAYPRVAGAPKEQLVTFQVDWSDSSVKRPTVRQGITTVFPIIRSVNGVDTVVDTARAVTTFVIPDSMTEAEAKDLNAFHHNGSQQTVILPGRTTREPIWG